MLELVRNNLPKETMMPIMLLFLVFSWGLYPMMGVAWFFFEIRYIVLMLFVLLVIIHLAYREKQNNFELPMLIRWAMGFYFIYFVSLGFSSVASGDSFSMIQYTKYTLKILFFILLLNIMTETLIKKKPSTV